MFLANNISKAARQAAKYNGLANVARFEVVSNIRIVDELDLAEKCATVVIRAYSKSGQKSVKITAGNLYMMETQYQDAPMARIVN